MTGNSPQNQMEPKKKMLYDDEVSGFLMGAETNREIKRRAAPASFPYYRGS